MDDSEVIATTSKDIIYSKFDTVKINRGKRGGILSSENDVTSNSFQPKNFFLSIQRNDIVAFRDIRTEICKLKKKQLKSLYIYIIGRINDRAENTQESLVASWSLNLEISLSNRWI